MKKVLVIFTTAVLLAAFAGCGSAPAAKGGKGGSASTSAAERKVPSTVPDFVKQALRNVPEDALVGIGTAKLANTSQSMTFAQTRARTEISRQLNTIIQDMVRDYQASSEVDPSSAIAFQENFTMALSKSNLTGSSVVEMGTGPDGAMWAVVMLNKTSTANEINQNVAAAKLAVPAFASFDAQDRMDSAFAKALGGEVQVADRDR